MQGLGNRIKSIRLELGETMEEFGARFNTSKGTINNWEKERNKPNKNNLKAIAELGQLSVEELLYGTPKIKYSLDEFLYENSREYIDNRNQVRKLERDLRNKGLLEGFSSLLGLGKGLSDEAIDNYERHQERINALEKFATSYIENNYNGFTFDKFLQKFPNSTPQDFYNYIENEWKILEQLLDNFWEAFNIPNQTDYWINKRFTDHIRYELDLVSKLAIEEGKEHYYVNEVVQPFLDQAAKDFKEYIKEYIDTED
ncbi:helix-turn-helix transcriptional regulator [Aerococcaceae bacterium DSM 111176]|nr:helix-turn-helix transcriptional regulator [Aerococcaceae bacterium DSM 111176]